MAVLLRPLLSGLIVTLVAMVAYLSLQNASLREAAARHAKEDAEQVAKLAEAVAKLHITVLDATNTLNIQAATIKESTNAQVRSLTAQRDDLRRRLRQSQANLAKSAVPAATPAASAGDLASGGEATVLYSTPGYDVVSEAYRADLIRTYYESCEKQYGAARAKLAELASQQGK